jgi:uncharacterized protein (TIGR02453 family)
MFSNDLLKFFAELERNNNREWFTANKARYEDSVLAPALEFVRSMAPRLARISKHLVADDRKSGGSMMRIYRDVRFSKDKTPYNAHIAFRFMHAKPGGLGYYLGIDPKEVMLGAGVWRPDKGPLERIRKAIAGDCKLWKKAMSAKGWEPGGESLSRPPRGFDKEHPCIDDIRRKDFVLFRKLAPPAVTKKDFADEVVAGYVTAKPQVAFLARALGLPF